MYVLNEDEYKEYKRYKATLAPKEIAAKCSICGREFPNNNMLGHHLKSHVNGFQCNICGKVLKTKRALTLHLKQHPLQVETSSHSVLDKSVPLPPKANKRKQRSVLNFDTLHWLRLK